MDEIIKKCLQEKFAHVLGLDDISSLNDAELLDSFKSLHKAETAQPSIDLSKNFSFDVIALAFSLIVEDAIMVSRQVVASRNLGISDADTLKYAKGVIKDSAEFFEQKLTEAFNDYVKKNEF